MSCIKTPAKAEPVSDDCVAEQIAAITRENPRALQMWARWADLPVEAFQDDYLMIAPKFPMLNQLPTAQLIGAGSFEW